MKAKGENFTYTTINVYWLFAKVKAKGQALFSGFSQSPM